MKKKVTKEDVKKWAKEHKKEIAFAVASSITCGVIAGIMTNKLHGPEQELIDILRSFNGVEHNIPLVEGIIKATKDSRGCFSFSGPEGTITLNDITESIKDYCESAGVSMETPLAGLVIFTK